MRRIINWAYVGAVVVFLAIASNSSVQNPGLDKFLAAAAVVLLLIILPFKIVLTRDWARRGRAIRKDLSVGRVKIFSGQTRSPLQDLPQDLRLLRRPTSRPFTLEILSGSGRVWTVHGLRVQDWLFLSTVQVSALPTSSARAKDWVRKMEAFKVDGQSPPIRELTESEKIELAKYARKLWLRVLPLAAGLTIWFSVPLTLSFLGNKAPDAHSQFGFVAFGVLTILTDALLISEIWRSRMLMKDQRLGVVLLLPEPLRPGVTASPTRKVAEVLPHSEMVWSIDDAPARWRTVSRRN